MNSEHEAEKAGFDTLSADQKAAMERYKADAAKDQRMRMYADEAFDALRRIAEISGSPSAVAIARAILAKIEDTP